MRLEIGAFCWLSLCQFANQVQGWCVGIGYNPTFTAAPKVSQEGLTSVRISWDGLVDHKQCADNYLVSYWLRGSPQEYKLTKPFLPADQFSVVIDDFNPGVPYVFQVIAREDKGLLGVDYNRSPHVPFTLKRRYQKQQKPPSPVKEVEVEEVDSNTVGRDDSGNGVINRSDEGVTSQNGQHNPDVKNESGHQSFSGNDIINRDDPVYLELEEEWKSENAGRNIAIIVGSVIGIILFIIVAAGAVYRVVQVRRAKHTLPSDDGEGNATYDRFEDNCHCNS